MEALQRKRTETALRHQLTRIGLLSQIARSIAERLDAESIFRITLERLEQDLSVEASGVCLYDAPSDTLRLSVLGR